MIAAVAVSQNADDPLAGLEVREKPKPDVPQGWSLVKIVTSSINMHDVWTLRGVGHPPELLPRILGCDAAGYDEDGNRVVVHGIIGDLDRGRGDETLDPKRSLLSEQYEGTFAEYVAVPARNLVPLPDGISFADAACLPVAWGTAYRMLATQAKLRAGDTVLVQGSAGGVNSAAIKLAVAMGATVYATSRTDEKLALAESWGARGIADGARLPEQVDYVIDNVGEATWSHSVKSLRPGGAIVTCGATTGMNPSADLGRIFYQQKRVLGSTMCTLTELQQLVRVMENTGVRPLIDSTVSLENIRDGFETLLGGDVRGKIVVRVAEDD
ncbi:molecular chaperone GroES [Dermacoccus sp. PE3]|uniref:zinc-binding dehydrogenase n=1 Tax=Dermacoccus sp. PE3 TaxID=1641401 RepID=UPI000641D9EB|nr:quinone oxidoreductase [Dermacoccus sp. PE3]KLO62109.1 molecular chaperone GroES [Dermacoccus sp. PE3]